MTLETAKGFAWIRSIFTSWVSRTFCTWDLPDVLIALLRGNRIARSGFKAFVNVIIELFNISIGLPAVESWGKILSSSENLVVDDLPP